jgi:hypothetical protein
MLASLWTVLVLGVAFALVLCLLLATKEGG